LGLHNEQAGSVDVTIVNPRDLVYIKGNATTDGSIRYRIDIDETVIEVGKKDPLGPDILFNDTGLRVGSSSISLGRDLRVGAAGAFIETFNLSEIEGHFLALIPNIAFDARGSVDPAQCPIVDIREDFIIFDGPVDGTITGKVLGQSLISPTNKLLHSTSHITGITGATAPVQFSFYKGTDNTGDLLLRLNLFSSLMSADTAFTVEFDDDLGFEAGVNVFFEFVSEENISLRTNAAGEIITTQNGHVQNHLDMILDELVVTNDLSLTFDNSLGLITHNRFS